MGLVGRDFLIMSNLSTPKLSNPELWEHEPCGQTGDLLKAMKCSCVGDMGVSSWELCDSYTSCICLDNVGTPAQFIYKWQMSLDRRQREEQVPRR